MKLKRKWTMGIIATVSVLILAACGGESTPTSPIAPRADLVSPTVAAQTPTAILTVVAEIPVRSTVTSLAPAQETVPVSSDDSSRFIWEISTVDDNGAKPSLAVNRDGVPHIGFMLEAMPGFFKHALLGDAGWDITTIAEGYFYGPLDIELDRAGDPGISWHNHDEENEA